MSRTLRVTIIGDSRSAEAAFRRLSGSAGGFGSRIGGAARVAGAAFTAIGAAAGLGLGYAVKQAADFQSSLNTFQAVSGATAGQLQKVSSLAKRLGADITLPATSAKDAADAMLELNKAGLSVSQTMKAAKGVLQLSAAAETSNARAAQITANALNAYGLAGGQAAHVADLLAASAIAASGEMTDMAEALTQTAATAAQAHVSINDTVTAISEMANKGIIGSQSGAALQQMLLKLETPTKKGAEAMKQLGVNIYDAHGQMVPFRSVVDQFSRATEHMSDAQRNAALNSIFGSRAIRAANIVLLGGTQAFDKMSAAVNRQGAAADVAKAKMKGLHGSVQALQSAGQTLAITLGTPLLGILAGAALKVAGLVDWINRLAEKMGEVHGFSAKFAVASDAIQGALQKAIGSVDWSAVWARAHGIGEGLATKFRSIDWSSVGSAIGDGFAAAVAHAVSAGKGIVAAFQNLFRSIDWNALGRAAGPGIAAAMLSAVSTLSNPSFWIHNWDLALSVALVAFGDGLGRVAGKFGLMLIRPLSRAFETGALELAALVERLFGSRVASAALAGLVRLPGMVATLLGRLVAPVQAAFAKLGRLARFAIKVLGVDAAINVIVDFAHTVKSWIDKVVAWFHGLPGQIIGALSGVSLAGIGAGIMGSLLHGLEAGWEKAKGFLHSVTSLIPHIKGPESKDRVLLYANGQAIMGGLLRGLQSGWGDNEVFLSKVAGRLAAAMARLQTRLDASQRSSQDASDRQALADAEKQLAEARKKGKGLADAEHAVQDALQQIRDTAAQRELDRLTRQHDKILAKLQSLKDKAAAKLQKLQDAAGSAFDDLAGRIQRAFDAKNAAFVAPAQQMIDSIQDRRTQEDLKQAVTDAQAALTDAIANGSDVTAATRQLQRAQEDITLDSLQKQAADQVRAQGQVVDAQQDALTKMLDQLRTKLTEQGEVYNDGMNDILAIIKQFDGPFADVGAALGDAFMQALLDAAKAAAAAGGAVKNPNARPTGGGVVSGGGSGRILHLARGGNITAAGLAFVHAGERVSPGSASASPLTGGDGPVVHVTVNGWVGSDQDIAGRIRRELLRTGFQNSDIFGGRA